jgi:hypothetical protein
LDAATRATKNRLAAAMHRHFVELIRFIALAVTGSSQPFSQAFSICTPRSAKEIEAVEKPREKGSPAFLWRKAPNDVSAAGFWCDLPKIL